MLKPTNKEILAQSAQGLEVLEVVIKKLVNIRELQAMDHHSTLY